MRSGPASSPGPSSRLVGVHGQHSKATFGMLLAGYSQAYRRFGAARHEQEDMSAYWALFECLNWAVAIDDAVAAWWAPEGTVLGYDWRDRIAAAEAMAGVRYARNRVHHQWADALREVHDRTYPKTYPARYFDFVWRERNELPPPPSSKPDERGAEIYDRLLAGESVDATLRTLHDVFEQLWRFLEFPGTVTDPVLQELLVEPTE